MDQEWTIAHAAMLTGRIVPIGWDDLSELQASMLQRSSLGLEDATIIFVESAMATPPHSR